MEEFTNNIEKFLPFLEDLRKRLYRGVILFTVVFLGGFFSAGEILKKTLGFAHLDQVTVTTHSPFEFVDVSMDVGFFLAIMVCIPYIIYSLYAFIIPALTREEKIKLLKSIPLSIGLFVVGFLYCVSVLYYALGLFAAINVSLGIANFWNISQFLSEIFITSALFGLLFEFPILLTLLINMGIITPLTLKNKRRVVHFLIFCLVALLPPTDGISFVVMSLPLVLLYEVTILLNNKKTSCLD